MLKDLNLTSDEFNAIVEEVLRRLKEDSNAQVLVAKQEESHPAYEKISSCLINLGMPTNLLGYRFVRLAICMCIDNIENLNYVTKILYTKVAKKYKTTPNNVERAIRHAIEVAWRRGNTNVFNEMFGYTIPLSKRKPTNSEFVGMITDRIKRELIKEN